MLIREPYAVYCRRCDHQHNRCTCSTRPTQDELYVVACIRMDSIKVPYALTQGHLEQLTQEQLDECYWDLDAEIQRRQDERNNFFATLAQST